MSDEPVLTQDPSVPAAAEAAAAPRDETSLSATPKLAAASRVPQHDVGRWLRLARKELRETLRDRRTIITLLLMPILVYPLLSVGFRHFALGTLRGADDYGWRVALDSEAARAAFEQDMVMTEQFLGSREENPSANPPAGQDSPDRVGSKNGDDDRPRIHQLRTHVLPDPAQGLQAGDTDVVVRIHRVQVGVTDQGAPVERHEYELTHRQDSLRSRILAHSLEQWLSGMNELVLQGRLQRLEQQYGAPDLGPLPFSCSSRSIRGPSSQSLLTLVPLILILMTITGAVYPAIDLTAGERERGTLEALMAAPVPRLGMLFAKYVAVVTVALMTAAMNLAAMFITAYSTGLSRHIFGEQGLSITSVVLIILLLVLFAAFFSAVLLAVTSFARSFKEAQAYLIPLMLLSISPGLFTLMPGVQMNAWMAVTPLLNMVLLARDVLEGHGQPLLGGLAVFSTILYSLVAIALAARIFGSDAILHGSQANWGDLFRRPDRPRPAPSVAGAALCTALVFALQSILVGFVAPRNSTDEALRWSLAGAALVTVVVFGLFPLVMARLQFVKLSEGFQLRRPTWTALVGGVLLGLSLWPLAHELILLSGQVRLEHLERVRELAERFTRLPPALLLVCVALIPGACEEWFFRGYLLGSLRGRTSGWSAVALVALLFGLFHVFTGGTVRFLPSTLLGLVLGWVCLRTRSLFPSIVLHAVHNGLLVLTACYRHELEAWGIGAEPTAHLPAAWLVASLVTVAAGMSLIWIAGRTSPPERAAGLEAAA